MWRPMKRQKRVYRCQGARWNASLLSLTLPLALVCLAHFHTSIWRVNTHKASFLALITLHTPTDGDVEAIDAEGGTPTLPKTMLLGVGFHRSAAVRFALTPFDVFHCLFLVTVCCSCSLWVPLLQEGVEKREKKMQISDFAWFRLPLEDRHLLLPVRDSELENLF